MDDMRATSEEELRLGVTGVDSGRSRGDFVHEEVVVEAKHIEGRVWSVPPFEEITIR